MNTGRHKVDSPVFAPGAYPDFLDAADADQRACRDADLRLFFPEVGEPVDPAKAICRRCPLEQRCKAWALSRPWLEVYGVWGGTTQIERKNHQLRGFVQCRRCKRFVMAAKHGAPVRHKNARRGRWCE